MAASRGRRTPTAARHSPTEGRGDRGSATGPSASRWALHLPLALTLALLLLSLTPRVQASARLVGSFWAAVAVLLVWQVVLQLRLRATGQRRSLTTLFRRQHWVQALCQLSVFLYWGWYWRPVYDMAALFIAQLLFAYAVDMLLQWSRREAYVLGFGPFPIIFSINLFLWFRDDWFYLQFLMIAVGILGKELVRWERGGRRVHVFNPSALSLGLFSLVLIATSSTDLTWGPEIASTLTLAPRIYTFLFVVGLVVMYFFSITLVAGSAAAVLFGLSAIYYAATGVPWFLDSEIPAAVFLGLHLLVTDPSTSPRSPVGKALFGALYGTGVFALYGILTAFGAPTFYDKLLCVPLLNLSVRGIDGFVERLGPSTLRERLAPGWPPARLNLVHMAIWVVFFGAMAATGRTDGRHVGDSLPFWEEACDDRRPSACERLLQLEATYCLDNSAWACNELGVHHVVGRITPADPSRALAYFSRACELRFQAACINVLEPATAARAEPRPLDLRLLLREGGRNLMDLTEPELYRRACDHRWSFACERVASAG